MATDNLGNTPPLGDRPDTERPEARGTSDAASLRPRSGSQVTSAKTASGINVIASIWLIISPFVLQFYRSPAATWNNIIVGIAVLVLAAIQAGNPVRNVGLSWVNLLLGLWLFVSGWVLRFALDPVPMRNNIVLGIIVFICAIWSLAASPPDRIHDGANYR